MILTWLEYASSVVTLIGGTIAIFRWLIRSDDINGVV
jgi:hypothetical protein